MSIATKPRSIGRTLLAVGALILAGSTALFTWWTTTLTGLPDVGDPFDIEAFCQPIPDDTNAFVLYKQAAAILPKEPDLPANYDWATAPQAQRDWIDESHEAFALWKKGTERPDALYVNPAAITFDSKLDVAQALRSFCRMALVEGSRLEGEGDFDKALDLYLSVLRCSRHCGKRGTFIERMIGMHRWAGARLTRWAADAKVDARMLRRALDAAIAAEKTTAPTSDGLKDEYLGMIHSFGDPEMMVKLHDYEMVPDPKGGSTTVYGQHGWKSGAIRVGRRSINEPERSRRVIRMIFANWLAYCDLPSARQPRRVGPSANATMSGSANSILSDLYVVGEDAPTTARALPPEQLACWFASTMDAKLAVPNFIGVDKAIAGERSSRDAMLFTLAIELYKREHGQYPERNEELVGPYLEELPPGYSAPR